MKAPEIVDTRGDYVVIDGKRFKLNLKQKLSNLTAAYEAVVKRMKLEMPSIDAALALLVTLEINDNLNENALFFKSCIQRAAFLEKEIAAVNLIAATLVDEKMYLLSAADVKRFSA